MLTLREKLLKIHPELVSPEFGGTCVSEFKLKTFGGAVGCPDDYDLDDTDECAKMCPHCEECWSRKTHKKKSEESAPEVAHEKSEVDHEKMKELYGEDSLFV